MSAPELELEVAALELQAALRAPGQMAGGSRSSQQPGLEWEFENSLQEAAGGLEWEHHGAYQTARQKYLRQLLQDPNQPAHVRGWIRQELNRLGRIQRAKAADQRRPGGDPRRLRGVPGADVGHKLGRHGQHDPKNFRLEDAHFNRARPGHARRLGLFNRYRESEAEFLAELEAAAGELQEHGEGFFTRVQPIPHLPGYEEGHEVLTRNAAAGLVTGADLNALLAGVITPDRGGVSYWKFPRAALHAFSPAAQRAHSLRATPGTPQAAALGSVRSYLETLYRNALSAPTRSAAMLWIGHALHLIQDSYSGAHISRTLRSPSGPNPIRYIRVFHVQAWPPSRSTAPGEHNAPSDPRDSIWAGPGSLRTEARFAVSASREFLALMLRHLRAPRAPGNLPEFRAFLSRHLST